MNSDPGYHEVDTHRKFPRTAYGIDAAFPKSIEYGQFGDERLRPDKLILRAVVVCCVALGAMFWMGWL